MTEWRAVRLKHVASVRVSNVDKKSADDQLPVKLCNYTDVYYNENIDSTIPFMAATASTEQVREFQLQRGDVLITKDSETPDDIAVPAYVADAADGVVCGYHLALLRPRRSQVHGRYLFWSLKATPLREQFAAGATGVTRFGLRTDVIGDACLLLPEPSGQRVVADFLDAEIARIDALIAKKHALASLVEERFLEEVRSRVTGGSILQDPLHVTRDEVVDGWRPAKLSWHLTFGSGTTPPAGDDRFYGPGTPWIVTANLRDGVIREVAGSVTQEAFAQFSALQVHPPGALVVAMYGATVGRLGLTTFPAATNQACCVMHSGSEVDVRFLFLYLLAHRNVLLERSVGAGQPNVSQEILRSLRIAIPSREDQRLADELFERRRKASDVALTLHRQIALLQERRQALITAAVTGQLDIPGMAA